MTSTIQVDGASRGNPGPSAVAWIIQHDESIVDEGAEFVGEGTNNRAEWIALTRGLERAREQDWVDRNLTVQGDSELVIKQITGVYRCRDEDLRRWFDKASGLIDHFEEVGFEHIPREQNELADALANEVLDEQGY